MNLTHDEKDDLILIAVNNGTVPASDFETPQEQARLGHLVGLGLVQLVGEMVNLTDAGWSASEKGRGA